MLFQPRRVMEDLARQPRWILPVAIGSLPPAIAFVVVLSQSSSGLSFHSLGSEFIDLLVVVGGAFAGRVVFLLVSAIVLVGLIKAVSHPLSVLHALALVSYSLVPEILATLLHSLFHAGVVVLQLESPLPHWIWLNAASFLDGPASHSFVYSLVCQIGVFPLWRWLLVAIGLTTMVRSVSFRVAFTIAVVTLVLVGSIWAFAVQSGLRLFLPTLP